MPVMPNQYGGWRRWGRNRRNALSRFSGQRYFVIFRGTRVKVTSVPWVCGPRETSWARRSMDASPGTARFQECEHQRGTQSPQSPPRCGELRKGEASRGLAAHPGCLEGV